MKQVEAEGSSSEIKNPEKQTSEIFSGDNYVAQKLIVQHEILSEIHTSSVNTLRVMSILMNRKVNNLSTVLRMG